MAGEGGDGEPPVSLAERLAAAEAAMVGPCQRVSYLEAALQAAVERSDFAEAAELQEQLQPAREALALAEVDVRVITEAQAAVEQERQAAQRAVEEAQQRDRAQQVMEQAEETRTSAQAAIDSALAEFWDHVRAARDAYRRGLAAEGMTRQAGQAEAQARGVLEPLPPGHSYPVPAGENRVSVLADNSPLVRELAAWRG